MSISKKPKTISSQSEAKVQALIEKGGSAAQRSKKEKKQSKEVVPISLRLPRKFSERIEAVLEKRALKIPRHTWLLEAVIEKLEREEEGKNY